MEKKTEHILQRIDSQHLSRLWSFYRDYFKTDEKCLAFIYNALRCEPVYTIECIVIHFPVFSGFFVVPKERRSDMKKVSKVFEYRRKPDGTYERIETEHSMPRPSESGESMKLHELACYGNTVCRIKDESRWAELRCVPVGIYTVGSEQLTVPETYIVVTKSKAFLFNSHRYARELKMWQQETVNYLLQSK